MAVEPQREVINSCRPAAWGCQQVGALQDRSQDSSVLLWRPHLHLQGLQAAGSTHYRQHVLQLSLTVPRQRAGRRGSICRCSLRCCCGALPHFFAPFTAHPPHRSSYDHRSIRRGYQVYTQVRAAQEKHF